MKSKLNFLIGMSLNRKIKSKWFVIANIFLFIIIVGVINIDSIIKFFGGDFENAQEIYIKDYTNRAYKILENQILSSNIEIIDDKQKFKIEKYEANDINEFFNEHKKALVIELTNTSNDPLKAKIISKSKIDSINYQLIVNALTNTKVNLNIIDSKISMEEFNKIYESVDIERQILNSDKNTNDENQSLIMTTVFPIVILPFFMLTIFLVQMIGAEVNDEKTTRGMEIIISNVSPITHFTSKIVAGNLFVIIQGTLLIIFAALGALTRYLIGGTSIQSGIGEKITEFISTSISQSFINNLIYIIPLALILMLITFVAYSLLAGILASMTTNTEDFQQLQTPIMIISLIGYYLSIMSSVFNGALFIKIFAFIPFVSAILAPSLLVLGQFSILDMIISIFIMIIVIYLLIKYGIRIYKVGILNYSSKDLWKKMFKAIKERY